MNIQAIPFSTLLIAGRGRFRTHDRHGPGIAHCGADQGVLVQHSIPKPWLSDPVVIKRQSRSRNAKQSPI